MTPRQARIALGIFAILAGGVIHNALYMQGDPVADRPVADASEAQRSGTRANRSLHTKPVTKRVAVAKGEAPKGGDRAPAQTAEAGADTIRAVQRELDQRGYGPLAIDGVMRPVTRAAILSWEYDQKLPLTGEASEALLARLVLGAPGNDTPSGAREVQSPHAEATIRQVQRLLSANGYRPGPADGRLGADTVEAIRAFEKDQGLAVKGRVSAELYARLQTNAARLKSAEAR